MFGAWIGRIMKINLCVLGCPLPLYIKEQGGVRPALGGGAPEESYSHRE